MKTDDIVEKIPVNVDGSGCLELNVRSYAGYADAGFKEKQAQLFYWFFESQRFHPEQSRDTAAIAEAPLIIWLNGGPGAPSTLGLFLENGPYRIQNAPQGELIENEFSWNREAHVIYWDQPIGTGYSSVKGEHPQVTYAASEDELSEMFYSALQSFLVKHPEYRSCPLYVMGESYGGKYVPNIALKIYQKNSTEIDQARKINLQGIAVGDGWIDARLQIKVYIDYAYTMGYLDTHQKARMLKDYERFTAALDAENWGDAYATSNDIVEDVSALGGGFNLYNITLFSEIPMDKVQAYMELAVVKEALHVPQGQPWNCADNKGPVAENLIEDNMRSSLPCYSKFISLTGYKVLLYTGTLDTACGSVSTEQMFYGLNKWDNPEDDKHWQTAPRRVWAQPHNRVKGFIKQYKNLTQIVLPNSGHQVPYYKPEISREMIYRWMKSESFPTYSPKLKTEGQGNEIA